MTLLPIKLFSSTSTCVIQAAGLLYALRIKRSNTSAFLDLRHLEYRAIRAERKLYSCEKFTMFPFFKFQVCKFSPVELQVSALAVFDPFLPCYFGTP